VDRPASRTDEEDDEQPHQDGGIDIRCCNPAKEHTQADARDKPGCKPYVSKV